MSSHRKELTWIAMAFTLLLGAISWFFISMVTDIKDQNAAQWRTAGQTKDCMFENIAKLRERVARIEGRYDHDIPKSKKN